MLKIKNIIVRKKFFLWDLVLNFLKRSFYLFKYICSCKKVYLKGNSVFRRDDSNIS